jgi:hypothetical protein
VVLGFIDTLPEMCDQIIAEDFRNCFDFLKKDYFVEKNVHNYLIIS